MKRLANIPKDTNLLKIIKLAINDFNTNHNTNNYYIANKLHFNGENKESQFNNLLNPNNEKYLKVDELLLILDSISDSSKIVLNYLCQRFGFILSSKAETNKEKTLLHSLSSLGNLSSSFTKAMEDDNLSKEEKQELKALAYKARQDIISFENLLDKDLNS